MKNAKHQQFQWITAKSLLSATELSEELSVKNRNYRWKTHPARIPVNNRENFQYPIRGYRIIQELSAKNHECRWKSHPARVPVNNRENFEYPIRGYRIIKELSAKNRECRCKNDGT